MIHQTLSIMFKNSSLLTLGLSLTAIASQAQSVQTPQPDSTICIANMVYEDALMRDLSGDSTHLHHGDFASIAWTYNGTPVKTRGILQLDLSNIPANAHIESAHISLHGYQSPSNTGSSDLSGSNKSYLRRTNSNFNIQTVTWNTQPTVTTQNEVALPSTSNPQQSFLNVDITQLVQDMIIHPNEGNGIMLILENEQLYRKMVFASKDNNASNVSPVIEVCYKGTLSTEENQVSQSMLSIYPIPSSNVVNIELEDEVAKPIQKVVVYSLTGQLVYTSSDFNGSIDVSGWATGMYTVQVELDDEVVMSKFIVK